MNASRNPSEGESKESPSEGTAKGSQAKSATDMGALRDAINRIDGDFLKLLSERRAVSLSVAKTKVENRSRVRDQKREEEMLVRLIRQGREQGLDAHYVTRIFHEIIDDSVRLQQDYLQRIANAADSQPELIRVAFQGVEGAYSHLAAQNFFAKDADRLTFSGFHTFPEAVKAVEEGQADRAMLPIENTTSGAINEVYDLLLHTPLSIVGEEKFLVKHCLIAAKDVPIESIKKVFSHYQAVAQCGNFLSSLKGCTVEFFTDTAMSVAKIKEEGDPTQAAIASEEAARVYGLHILKRNLANQRGNYTRFVVLANQPIEVDVRIPCKTSIVMRTGQTAGSLLRPLQIFHDHSMMLSKLESRPILNNPGEEMFYLDFEGNVTDERIKSALDEIRRQVRFLKVLGCYPSRDLPLTTPPIEAITGGIKSATEGAPTAKASLKHTATSTATNEVRSTRNEARLSSRDYKSEDTVIDIKGVNLGGSSFVVIAGPQSAKTREEIFSIAREAKEHGGSLLRSSRFSSQSSTFGEGSELEYLCEAGRTYDLPVVSEVISPKDVGLVAQSVDIVEINAQDMHNTALLREVGRIHRPVLLRRGLRSSIEEFMDAAEIIMAQGNLQVILCESGTRTFETGERNTLDPSAVALLKANTHLPILVDPSSAAGEPGFIPPLCLASKVLGAHGIVVELHPDPKNGMSEGAQSLDFAMFGDLMANLFG